MGNKQLLQVLTISYMLRSFPISWGNFISRAIIDKNCRIGNNVHIEGGNHLNDGDYGSYHVVDGIVIVPKGSVIEDGTQI